MNKRSGIKEKELLKKKISELDHNEQCEIFNIIRKDTDKISENTNGIFINLKHLSSETIQKMSDFVYYCEQNKILMKKEVNTDNDLGTCKRDYNHRVNNLILKDEQENLSEGYDNYAVGEFSDKIIENDRFSFKTYMDKLSVTSTQVFEEDHIPYDKRTSIIKSSKIKLNGVKGRVMRACRNITKNNNNINNTTSDPVSYSTLEDLFDTIPDDFNDNYTEFNSNKSSSKNYCSDEYSDTSEQSIPSSELKEDSDIE